jgi:A/G-specific adenine glycosylase
VIAETTEPVSELEPEDFRQRLMAWYKVHARVLPWRGTTDPYRIWVSEIMLQQTRVAAVIEHYNEFLRRFPTLVSLSLATDTDVLAAWSGLGYYRRVRMLHKAAQFIVMERDGRLPAASAELRTLPGIGDYTAAAIASIAFGEAVAVVDGNVERVILRLVGRQEEATAAMRVFVRAQAQALLSCSAMPTERTGAEARGERASRPRTGGSWSAEERIALAVRTHPHEAAGGMETMRRQGDNPAGDHNQAMMELGATICLPRAPLCEQCPVHAMCRTRGEHGTPARAPQRSLPVACLLDLRKRGTATEILLSLRPGNASIMPAMFELPPLPLEVVEGREPVLRVRHAITNTNYYVQVFTPQRQEQEANGAGKRRLVAALRSTVPKSSGDLHWVNVLRLPGMPLTGLARKILQRLKVMEPVRMNVLE